MVGSKMGPRVVTQQSMLWNTVFFLFMEKNVARYRVGDVSWS
jgi:hypothetical protein